MRGIDIGIFIGIDTTETRCESTWYRYRKHKSGVTVIWYSQGFDTQGYQVFRANKGVTVIWYSRGYGPLYQIQG